MSNLLQRTWRGALKVTSFSLLAFAITLSSAQAASVNPFKKVAGKWRSAGATAVINGNKERIKCRASYKVPGRSVGLSLKCSGPGYFINVRVDARVIGRKVKGSWSESQFGKSGWLSGRASRSSSSLSFGGSAIKGSMRISLKSGRRHSIYIRSNGSKISIPLRR